ncbi:BamA/TamA family outer membrane protein [Qipengyuania sp. 6B39]|uniref:autotransporter assembly complex protein TamA n=1 Tax=Qipengyuania proteolytica TaxID=2867239 RepID=UPI001C8AD0BE|nr:BamA/TamA family outer membrane protein [Qipengyuania proteolytica]MBX7496665.1 BamA/TamA family outer membrane protein [Qipengyuania proteolytica]
MLCAATAALFSVPVAAQDRETSAELEELIPDSAVDAPEEWAEQGTDGEQPLDPGAMAEIEADTPIAELPDMQVAWPEDVEFAPIEDLEPESDIEFASLLEDRRRIDLADAETRELSDTLVLGFPQSEPPFSERDDFVSRFEALSTIEELENGEENAAQLAARARADEELLDNLLRVYGYYDGRIIRTIGARDAGDDAAQQRPLVRFDIIPGDRYRFGAIDLGNLSSAPDAESLRAAFGIVTGDYLQSDTIVQERFDLDRALGETGYPFAEIDEPELLIDHEREEGDLTMPVRPNGKYVFGDVVSSDPEFLSGRHLASIARFDPGDVYKRSLDMDLRRAVTATGLVSTVSVTPREVTPPQGDEPGVVDMDVTLQRAKLRTIAGAIGYGSEEGIRIQASWEHRNLFPPEGALKVRGILGTQEQLAGVTFRRNNFGGRDKVLTIDAYASTVDTDAFDANTVALSGTYERLSTLLFQKPFSWALGAEILATDERNRVMGGIPRPRQTYFVASVFGRATIDTSDSLLDPSRGFRLTGFVAPEVSRTEGSEYFYLRNQVDASYYQSVGERTVLAGRLRFASIQGAPTFAIAPSRRLYAGGGGSVRGYGYQTIGPENDLGEPTGGRSLVEASVEARIGTGLMGGAVSIVPFFDLGAVSIASTPDFRFVKYGAGIGVRYATGFGPIRLDVGVPLNPDPDDASVAVYVSLGQAF